MLSIDRRRCQLKQNSFGPVRTFETLVYRISIAAPPINLEHRCAFKYSWIEKTVTCTFCGLGSLHKPSDFQYILVRFSVQLNPQGALLAKDQLDKAIVSLIDIYCLLHAACFNGC